MPDTAIVAVLMSTYNGARFLEEQIDSILFQADVDVLLYLRDDCSTDATRRIVQEYSSRNLNVRIIDDNRRLGPANSFMEMLYYACEDSNASYFAFSDQDDIWKPGKLSKAVSAIRDFSEPALYCSNQTLYSDGIETGLRHNIKPNLTLPTVLFSNQISGCTMVFTRVLAELLSEKHARPEPGVLNMRMHDAWILLVALALGKVVYDSESHIDYRIHADNVVGTRHDGITPLQRMCLAMNAARRGESVGYRSAYAVELMNCFPDANGNGWDKVKELANYKRSIKDCVKLLRDDEMRKSSGESMVEYSAKVLFGVF